MDFNTGGGLGRSEDEQSRPLYGEEAGGRARGPAPRPVGSPGREFNLQDPVNSFIGTTRSVLLDPVNFFRRIVRRGDFVNLLVYALICSLISAFLDGLLGLLITPLFVGPGDTGEALAGGAGEVLVILILFPIYTAVALLIGAAVTHLLVMLLVRPQHAGFEATFRVGAYSQALQLINWIPMIGPIIAFVWAVVLYVLGLPEVHATTTGRAALVVLIPLAIVFLLAILFLAVIAAIVGGAIMSESQQF